MEQNKIVIDVVVHKNLDLFIVVFEESFSVFYGKLNNITQEFECAIVKEFIGRYKNVKFHENIPWIYATRKNKLLLFT
jgi:ribosome biogenesis protein ERB1